MEMKRVNGGKLRAIGYDASQRVLQVEMEGGSVYQYSGVSHETYRSLAASAAMASFFRDNIEEEYPARRLK